MIRIEEESKSNRKIIKVLKRELRGKDNKDEYHDASIEVSEAFMIMTVNNEKKI